MLVNDLLHRASRIPRVSVLGDKALLLPKAGVGQPRKKPTREQSGLELAKETPGGSTELTVEVLRARGGFIKA